MRSHEERVAETKRRIAARQRKKQRRRSTIATVSAAAACLVLIVGVSFAMPGMVAGIRPGDFAGYETAASMYGGGAALGYIVIGLLSFLLGVCVTVARCSRALHGKKVADRRTFCCFASTDALPWGRFTGRCTCCCSIPRRGSFMCRSSAGSPA